MSTGIKCDNDTGCEHRFFSFYNAWRKEPFLALMSAYNHGRRIAVLAEDLDTGAALGTAFSMVTHCSNCTPYERVCWNVYLLHPACAVHSMAECSNLA